MEWIKHDTPVNEEKDLYLCYIECGNIRILRHNKPCFAGMYLLFYITINPNNQYTFTHQIARLINMSEEEFENIMINEYKAELIQSYCFWPRGRNIANQLYFKNLDDMDKAVEWLFSIELMNRVVG